MNTHTEFMAYEVHRSYWLVWSDVVLSNHAQATQNIGYGSKPGAQIPGRLTSLVVYFVNFWWETPESLGVNPHKTAQTQSKPHSSSVFSLSLFLAMSRTAQARASGRPARPLVVIG